MLVNLAQSLYTADEDDDLKDRPQDNQFTAKISLEGQTDEIEVLKCCVVRPWCVWRILQFLDNIPP